MTPDAIEEIPAALGKSPLDTLTANISPKKNINIAWIWIRLRVASNYFRSGMLIIEPYRDLYVRESRCWQNVILMIWYTCIKLLLCISWNIYLIDHNSSFLDPIKEFKQNVKLHIKPSLTIHFHFLQNNLHRNNFAIRNIFLLYFYFRYFLIYIISQIVSWDSIYILQIIFLCK